MDIVAINKCLIFYAKKTSDFLFNFQYHILSILNLIEFI